MIQANNSQKARVITDKEHNTAVLKNAPIPCDSNIQIQEITEIIGTEKEKR